jgi:hypothetical protein
MGGTKTHQNRYNFRHIYRAWSEWENGKHEPEFQPVGKPIKCDAFGAELKYADHCFIQNTILFLIWKLFSIRTAFAILVAAESNVQSRNLLMLNPHLNADTQKIWYSL